MSRAASSAVRAILSLLALTAMIGAGAAFAGTDVGSVNFTLGRKSLHGDWTLGPPAQDTTASVGQPTLGVQLNWGRLGWPAMVAFDVLHSYDDGIVHVPRFFTIPAYDLRLRARTIEVGLGARRWFNVQGWSPYVGAGGSWVRGNASVEVIDPNAGQFGAVTAGGGFHATAFGYWVGGGLMRRIGPRFQIGLEGRYAKATLPLRAVTIGQDTLRSAREFDAGGRHINLVVGWSFPVRK